MSKRSLTDDDLATDWFLHPAERSLLANKSRTTHVGFSILLKFFQLEGRFPASPKEISSSVVQYVAFQLDASVEDWGVYPWDGATIKRHRPEIREWYGYREATINDKNAFRQWLISEAIHLEHREDRLREVLLKHCRAQRIEPPAAEQIRRSIQTALAEHETSFCNKIVGSMNSAIIDRLNALLKLQSSDDGEWTVWQTLKSDPGKAGLESIKDAVSRLQTVRTIGIPADLFKTVPPKLLERYAKRAAVEEPFELRRHAVPLQATLMAVFLHRRGEELTDHLVDLLVETVHKMGKKAENSIDESLVKALQC